MIKKVMPNSIRKYIRMEKARIRREFLNISEQELKIKDMYDILAKSHSEKKEGAEVKLVKRKEVSQKEAVKK